MSNPPIRVTVTENPTSERDQQARLRSLGERLETLAQARREKEENRVVGVDAVIGFVRGFMAEHDRQMDVLMSGLPDSVRDRVFLRVLAGMTHPRAPSKADVPSGEVKNPKADRPKAEGIVYFRRDGKWHVTNADGSTRCRTSFAPGDEGVEVKTALEGEESLNICANCANASRNKAPKSYWDARRQQSLYGIPGEERNQDRLLRKFRS